MPDGDKRVALVGAIELCRRDGYRWTPPPGDDDGEATATEILVVRRQHRLPPFPRSFRRVFGQRSEVAGG